MGQNYTFSMLKSTLTRKDDLQSCLPQYCLLFGKAYLKIPVDVHIKKTTFKYSEHENTSTSTDKYKYKYASIDKYIYKCWLKEGRTSGTRGTRALSSLPFIIITALISTTVRPAFNKKW